jgi:hypothetical protein
MGRCIRLACGIFAVIVLEFGLSGEVLSQEMPTAPQYNTTDPAEPGYETVTLVETFPGLPTTSRTFDCGWVPAGSVQAQQYQVIITGNKGWTVCGFNEPPPGP